MKLKGVYLGVYGGMTPAGASVGGRLFWLESQTLKAKELEFVDFSTMSLKAKRTGAISFANASTLPPHLNGAPSIGVLETYQKKHESSWPTEWTYRGPFQVLPTSSQLSLCTVSWS
jgi:hypothetical protein